MTDSQETRDRPTTNVAFRLLSVISRLQGKDDVATWKVFASALKYPADQEDALPQWQVAASISRLIKCLYEIRDRLRSNTDMQLDADTLDRPIDGLIGALTVCSIHLNTNWGAIRKQFSDQLITSLKFWARLLPKDELELPERNLEELRQLLRDAKDRVIADRAISMQFRSTMLELLRLLEEAIEAYAYGGTPAVQAALRAFAVSLYAARDQIKANAGSSAFASLQEVWPKVKTVMDVAVYSDALLTAAAHGSGLFDQVLTLIGPK